MADLDQNLDENLNRNLNQALNQSLKEVAYVAVGLGVIGFQKAQVQRRELARQLREQRPQLESQVESQLGEARHRLAELMAALGEQLRGAGKAS